VRRDGALSVDVELVDATSQTRMWGDTYQMQPSGVLSVQKEIATQVSSALQLRLSGEEQQALRRHYPVDAEAYQLYLKGQHQWYRYSPDGYRKSLEYFQQAIARDTRYALAHAGVARVLSAMAYEGLLPPSTYLEVRTAASTALSLDDSLGAAHDALAQVQFAYLWNWEAAEPAFKRALELSPRDEAVHRMRAIFLRTLRRWDEAIAEMQQALALNPVSAETTKALGATYFWAGRHDLAIEQYERALALDPTHAQTHDLLADAYAASGQYARALESRRRYLTLEGAHEAADALGADTSEAAYRKAMHGLYRRYLARLEQDARDPRDYISPMEFAFVYIGIGDTERAFGALEQAFSQRAPWLSSLAADPAFEPLRSDPRFTSLLSRVGVPLRTS
jgi:tetratricopeptide (TPR) repeat protein